MRLQCVRVWSTVCSQWNFRLYRCLCAPQVPHVFFFSSVTVHISMKCMSVGKKALRAASFICSMVFMKPFRAAPDLCILLSVQWESILIANKDTKQIWYVCVLTLGLVFLSFPVCVYVRGIVFLCMYVCCAVFVCAILLLITRDYLWPPLTSSASLSSQPV